MKNQLIKILMYFCFLSFLSSCTIARLSIVGTRNYEHSVKYSELKKYETGSTFSLHTILLYLTVSNPHIEDAVGRAVRKVSGGVYMENVVVKELEYQLILFSIKQYRVKGDVWGVAPMDGAVKKKIVSGTMVFHIGDKISFKRWGNIRDGRIVGAVDNNFCYVEIKNLFGNMKKIKIEYERLSKTLE